MNRHAAVVFALSNIHWKKLFGIKRRKVKIKKNTSELRNIALVNTMSFLLRKK
jgi:hypothetical protein